MTDLKKIERQIDLTKNKLMNIEEMRPGSLTQQSREYKGKYGSYWQLSYTHMNKGYTDYIRKEFVTEIKKQVANYKRFKELVDKWLDLSIQHSKIKMKSAKNKVEK